MGDLPFFVFIYCICLYLYFPCMHDKFVYLNKEMIFRTFKSWFAIVLYQILHCTQFCTNIKLCFIQWGMLMKLWHSHILIQLYCLVWFVQMLLSNCDSLLFCLHTKVIIRLEKAAEWQMFQVIPFQNWISFLHL